MTWRKLHPCPDDNTMYAPSSLMEYLITGLDEGSTYNITVTVTNAAGSSSSSPVIATTVEEGKTLTICNITLIVAQYFSFSAPSAPPEDISVISSTFSMTVQWNPVPCIHHNGNITGYSIRYHKQGREEEEHQKNITAENTRIFINELQPSTVYVIEVAALNGAGTGIYGSIITSTLPCKLQKHINVLNIHKITVYAVEVSVLSTTPNSVTLTWSEADTVTHSNMMIRWERNNPCSFEDTSIKAIPISAPVANITIAELEEYSSYNITVSIGNSLISDSVIAVTNESGNFIIVR